MTSTLERAGDRTAAPQRTCVICRRERNKHELLRVAATPEGVRVDPTHQLPGRGAYVCPDPACIEELESRGAHRLRRALRTEREDQVRAAIAELAPHTGTEHHPRSTA